MNNCKCLTQCDCECYTEYSEDSEDSDESNEICDGNGKCLTQCDCECYTEYSEDSEDTDEYYNEDTDEYKKVCVCSHKEHNGYCPTNCCVPIECRNYKYCNVKLPNLYLLCHNGMCMNCAIQMGPHKYTNEMEDCCVCLENKIILILKCNHKVCNDCWYNITKEGLDIEEYIPPLCPLCRNLNNWKN
jgi:hypothetical protein